MIKILINFIINVHVQGLLAIHNINKWLDYAAMCLLKIDKEVFKKSKLTQYVVPIMNTNVTVLIFRVIQHGLLSSYITQHG